MVRETRQHLLDPLRLLPPQDILLHALFFVAEEKSRWILCHFRTSERGGKPWRRSLPPLPYIFYFLSLSNSGIITVGEEVGSSLLLSPPQIRTVFVNTTALVLPVRCTQYNYHTFRTIILMSSLMLPARGDWKYTVSRLMDICKDQYRQQCFLCMCVAPTSSL